MIIWSIAKTTIGDAMRKKVLQIFLVVAIGLIVISLSFSQALQFSAHEGSAMDLTLIKEFGLGLMAIAAWLISLIMGVQLIPQEIERRTIYTILSKPVKRYEFILGKYLGAILTLAVCVGMMGAVFLAVIAIKAAGMHVVVTPGAPAIKVQMFDLHSLYGILLIFGQFVVLSSVVLLLSVLVTPTVNFFLGLGLYLVGLMSAVTEPLLKAKSGSILALAHAAPNVIMKFVYWVGWMALGAVNMILPNFDRFNKTNAILHPEQTITNMGVYIRDVTMYGVLYALIAMTIAVICFEKKEV